MIKIEDGDEDQRSKTGVEATVVEYESAVHFCGCSAYNGAHKACQHAVTESVFSGKRTKTRCKCQAVDICLSGQRPRNVKISDQTKDDDQGKQCNVADCDRKYVFYMLPISRKGKGGKYDAYGCSGKSDTGGEGGPKRRQDKNQIQIS